MARLDVGSRICFQILKPLRLSSASPMTDRRTARTLRRTLWAWALAVLAFIQVISQFASLERPMYVVKWVAGSATILGLFVLGRCRLSSNLSLQFGSLVAIIMAGLVAQLGDYLDSRALALAASYSMTAAASF